MPVAGTILGVIAGEFREGLHLRPDARHPALTHRLSVGARQALISVAAALIAYVPTHLIGLHQGFWSAITAIGVAQARFRDTTSTARKQFIGAAIGGGVGLVLLLGLGNHLLVYAIAITISVLVCWCLKVGDCSQLAAITTTIILLVPQTGSPAVTFLSRVCEVGWGVCVGVGVVWVEALISPDEA
jgi:uncharacterized membrane protein YgaE (UPF0421/DUF939 family)